MNSRGGLCASALYENFWHENFAKDWDAQIEPSVLQSIIILNESKADYDICIGVVKFVSFVN